MTNEANEAADSGLYELAPEEPKAPVERWVSPATKAKQAMALPCPQCGYDLRGLRNDRCPECGLVLNYAAVRQAENKRDGVNDSSWFDGKAVAMVIAGLAVGAAVWGFQFGWLVGVTAFGLDFAFTVVIGWVIFFLCSVMWIGFDQPLRMTMVQILGAFGLYSGIAALLSLVPIPGIVTFFVGAAILVGLLSERLEIDIQDAIVVAILVAIAKVAFYLFAVTALLGG